MKKSLMVVYSHYPSDTRIRKEATTLVKNGFDVDVVCLNEDNKPRFEIFENVNIYRINVNKVRGSFITYLYLYIIFFLKSFFKVNSLFFKNRYNVIHIHNMPNFIVYTSIIPKLFGAKVILDLHDPSPEIFLSLSEKGYDSLMYKIALFEEKISIWFADHIITTNIAFRELFISRGCKENKISIVMNSPQTSIFNDVKIATTEKNKTPQKFRIMYNGTIIKRHGLDILVDAVYLLKDKITNIELNIYGDGEFLTEVMTKVKSLKISDFIKYRGSFLVDIIAEEIPKMDIGVIPNRLNVFTNLNFPIRVFEFIHFKKPIVVPQTKGIGDYFDEDSIFYFQPEIVNDLAEVILAIYNKSLDVEDIINNGYKVYQNNTWEIQSSILNQVYNKLIKLS